MADEQAIGAQQPASSMEPAARDTLPTASEGAITQEQDPVRDRTAPDLRIPLAEERRKRQEYERLMSDPDYIYERAKALGMAAGDEAPQREAPREARQEEPARASSPEALDRQIDYRLTERQYPDLFADPEFRDYADAQWVRGLHASEIVSKYQKLQDKLSSGAAAQKAREDAERSREEATTASTTVSTDSDAAEAERLRSDSSDWRNPKRQEAAKRELLKRLNRATNK